MKCPYCAEEIQNDAIKCRYCKTMLEENKPTYPRSGSARSRKLIIIIVVFIVLLGIISIVFMSIQNNEDKKYSDIFAAIKANNLQAVKSFVKKNPSLVNAKGSYDFTPLFEACAGGNKEIVEFLVSKGADVNAKDNNASTPLYTACASGNKDIVELLISNGANINARNSFNSTPLHVESSTCHKEMVELLISKGADVNAKDNNDSTPLYIACDNGNKDIAELLISNGADINVKGGYKNNTPLDEACDNGNKDIAELLISKGAKKIQKDQLATMKYLIQWAYASEVEREKELIYEPILTAGMMEELAAMFDTKFALVARMSIDEICSEIRARDINIYNDLPSKKK